MTEHSPDSNGREFGSSEKSLPMSTHSPSDEAASNRCLLYLFGELTPVESQRFEQQLQADECLQSELIRLSVAISSISLASVQSRGLQTHQATSLGRSSFWRRIAWGAASVAAAIMAMVTWFTVNQQRTAKIHSEELLVAQVWVEKFGDPELAEDPMGGFFDFSNALLFPPSDWELGDRGGEDSHLAWMVAAVIEGDNSGG